MKKLFLLALCALPLVFTSCEKGKKAVDPNNLTIAFEYRQVYNWQYNKIEFRSTSTPDVAGDLWYYFDGDGEAILIGNGYHIFANTGDHEVTVLYKPGVAPEIDAIHASRKFTITVPGVADSIWCNAVPKE